MRRHGMYALDFCSPALVEGALTYVRGQRYAGQVVALCFVPYAGLLLPDVIERCAARFEEVESALLLVVSGARPLYWMWLEDARQLRTPVLADLCGRLHRSFGVAIQEPLQRCRTFVIDRLGILRLRVSHDFLEHDLSLVGELIKSSQQPAGSSDIGEGDRGSLEYSACVAPGRCGRAA